MSLEHILLALIAVINLITFFIMANDKHKSIKGNTTQRLPEGIIFFLASAFGALGIYTAMLFLRHKTRKWYFQIGIPLIIIQNFIALYLIRQYIVINIG